MGIKIRIGANCQIEDNKVQGSGIWIHETYDDYYTATIHNNLVNGRPLTYLINQNDLTIDSNIEFGQIILVNCNNITITDQTLSYLFAGVFIYESSSIYLYNDTFEQNYCGLNSYDFDDGEIIDSRFAFNNHGVNLIDCTDNTFYRNTFLSNNVDLSESNSITTLFNAITYEENYWSSLHQDDPYARGVYPEISSLDDITIDLSDMTSTYPSLQWNVSDDNLAYYEIYVNDVQVTTGVLGYRIEVINWILFDFINESGFYTIRIIVTDHDSFFATDSLDITVTSEDMTTATTPSFSSTTETTSTTSTKTTSEELPDKTETTETKSKVTPNFGYVMGILGLLVITYTLGRRQH